jgi:uncharacterized protein (UPF0248 family)
MIKKENPIRNILLKIKMTEQDYGEKNTFVYYLNRGSPYNQAVVKVSDISAVRKGSFVLSDDEETQIPFHRIIKIVRMDQVTTFLYKNRKLLNG